jgi:hypothetical protein
MNEFVKAFTPAEAPWSIEEFSDRMPGRRLGA